MNEPAAKVSTPAPNPAPRFTPDGYRAGIITAISVLVGFSLSFLRYWAFDAPQAWSWREEPVVAAPAGDACLGPGP